MNRPGTARRRLAGSILLLALLMGAARGGRAAKPAAPPKLVVLIAVDQMRADYLERFASYFGDQGFRRLMREGKVFTQARYAHASTFTGPGHAVLGSGIYADRSGLVGNRWYSRDTGKTVNCALGPVRADQPGKCAGEAEAAGSGAGTKWIKSPCNFGAKSLAERIKQKYRDARVVGVSLKDRAAILTVGEGADAAYWLEDKEDGSAAFACSGYYPSCRDQALAVNAQEGLADPALLFRKHPAWREWTCSLPECAKACPDDVPAAHANSSGLGPQFPHPVKDAEAMVSTPFGNDLLETFAERVAESHDLGRNPKGQPDLLAVSFSSPDYLGHAYGPDSCEVADGMKRLDETLGRLLDYFVARVGRENLVVFLTADHGVAPLPEAAMKRGIPAGRIELSASVSRDSGKIGDLPELRRRMEFEIARRMGVPLNAGTPLTQAFVADYEEPSLYLNRDRIPEQALPFVRSWLKDYLLGIEGIAAAYTVEEILAGEAPESVRLAFRRDRSGDLMVLLRPYWIDMEGGGTTHGQTYDYDAHVPLLAWGRGVAAGKVEAPVDVAQISPTLAEILGLDFAGFSRPFPLPLDGRR